jgi:uncharacterized protein YlxP (DUF503 family)
MIPIGLVVMVFRIPGCHSLKEKRGLLKSMITNLRKVFNVSVTEVDYQDSWQKTAIACALAGSDRVVVERSLQTIPDYCEINFREFQLVDQRIELY